MKMIVFYVLMAWHTCAIAQTSKIDISVKNNSEREKAAAALLEQVLSEYDLSKWIFTDKILIEQGATSHSHPVLTLSTRSTDKKDMLDVFVHEQLHWYVENHPTFKEKAVAEFRKRYINVPFANRAGAGDEYSTYMHLIVCYLEYRSMEKLIGEEEAKQMMWNQNYYTWVYNKIIEDVDFVGKVVKESGFDLMK